MKTTMLFFILFFCLAILSQKNAYTQEMTKTDSLSYQLKQVTVTATRHPEAVLNVPAAVSIVTENEIRQSKGYGLDDALAAIPGVFVQSRFGNQDVRLTIRGFGNRGAGERSNAGTSRGIRVLIDGFPETEPDGRTSFDDVELSSIGKIEVMRSNATTAWGNASGGLVSISSNINFERSFLSLQTMTGSFGFRKDVFQTGLNVGDSKVYLNVSNTYADGWRDHSRSARTYANLAIVSPFAERSTLGVFVQGTTNYFEIPGPLSQTQFDANPQQAQNDTSYYKPTYVKRDERRFNRLGRIGMSLHHGFNEHNEITATAFANPKFLQRSERNTFRDFTRYHVGGSFMYRGTMQLSDNIKSATSVGIDEAYQDGAILFYSLYEGERDSILNDNKAEGANSFGIFFSEELTLNEKWSLSFGGRSDNITYFNEKYPTAKNELTVKEEKSFKHFTPKLGLLYRLQPTQSMYASMSGGVEVPAGNETDPAQGQTGTTLFNILLEPIVSTTLEVGTKHILSLDDMFIKSVSYDVTVYSISIKNDVVPYQSGRFYLTAGKSSRTGIEIGATSQMQQGLSMSLAVNASNNKYDEYIIDSVFTRRPIDIALTGKTLDLSGNKTIGIPGFTMNIGLRYEPSMLQGVYVAGALNHVGKYFANDINTLEVKAYSLINATFGYNNPSLFDGKISLKAFVTLNNLFDTKYAASAFMNPDYGRVKNVTDKQAIYLEPGLPGNFVGSVSLGYNF